MKRTKTQESEQLKNKHKKSNILIDSGAFVNIDYKNNIFVFIDLVKNSIVTNANAEYISFTFEFDCTSRELLMLKFLNSNNYSLVQILWKIFNCFFSSSGKVYREHIQMPNLFLRSESVVVFPSARSFLASLNASSSSAESSASSKYSCLSASINNCFLIFSNSTFISASIKVDNYIGLFKTCEKTSECGNVGIGTTTPTISGQTKEVDIVSSAAASSVGLVLSGTRTADGFLGVVDFANGATRVATISGNRVDADNSAEMRFYTNNAGGGLTQQMVISKTGNVGIGTTTPTEALSVTGNLSTTTGASLATSSGNVRIGTTVGAGTGTIVLGNEVWYQGVNQAGTGVKDLIASAAQNGGETAGDRVVISDHNTQWGVNGVSGISTSATTIWTDPVISGRNTGQLILVAGEKSNNDVKFVDLILWLGSLNPVVISSAGDTNIDTRTYTKSGNNLQLAMGANTYTAHVLALVVSAKGT